MKIKFLIIIFVFIFLSSCSKEDLGNIDYFAFGDAYGFCQGDCANFFMMKDSRLYPDNVASYNGTSLEFSGEALSVEKYDIAKKLIDNFPKYLIDNPDKTFGCPDCADQGGIHIEIQENGKITKWHFDTNIASLPAQIQDYVQEIKTVLVQLR